MFLLAMIISVLTYVLGICVVMRLVIGIMDNIHGGLLLEFVRWVTVSVLVLYALLPLGVLSIMSVFSIKLGLIMMGAHVLAWVVARKAVPL